MKNITVLFLAAAFFAACSSGEGTDKKAQLDSLKKEATEIQEQITRLETEIAATDSTAPDGKLIAVTVMQPQLFEHYIEVQAKVDGDENVAVSADMMGTVKRVNVQPGDKVSKGTVLAELDAAAMTKGLDEAENQSQFLKTVYEKQKSLWDQKVGSEIQYLSAKNNYEAAVKRSATLREQVEMSKIKSPINGTVDAVDIKTGQTVAPGMPAIRVVNLNKLKVKGEVAEAYVAKVKTGNEVVLVFPDLNKEVKTKLSYSGKVIDNLNRTFKVEADLNNKDANFHPNMIAILKIVDYKSSDAMVVPVNLIQQDDEGAYLYVTEKNGNKYTAVKRIVKTGQSYNGNIEILQGLKSGDSVITTGYQDLLNNEPVSL